VETRGDKAAGDALSQGWITAGEPVSPRGCHDLDEGKTLKEAVQKRLRHETRPWNSDVLGKPLRG